MNEQKKKRKKYEQPLKVYATGTFKNLIIGHARSEGVSASSYLAGLARKDLKNRYPNKLSGFTSFTT